MENIAALIGIAHNIQAVEDINGTPYKGYKCELHIERKSGAVDELIVMSENEPPEDKPVMVTGEVQAQKNFNTGRTLIYVYAEDLREITGKRWEYENDVHIIGSLGKGTTYRQTPRGKKIADTFIGVKNKLYETVSYVPCICWNEIAEKMQQREPGDVIEITGRLQSRKYTKVLSDGTAEERTAYEISAAAAELLQKNK